MKISENTWKSIVRIHIIFVTIYRNFVDQLHLFLNVFIKVSSLSCELILFRISTLYMSCSFIAFYIKWRSVKVAKSTDNVSSFASTLSWLLTGVPAPEPPTRADTAAPAPLGDITLSIRLPTNCAQINLQLWRWVLEYFNWHNDVLLKSNGSFVSTVTFAICVMFYEHDSERTF